MKNKKLKLTPSIRRVYSMNKDTLLSHYSLIINKSSSLSHAQREAVVSRVIYGIHKKTITPKDVSDKMDELNSFLVENVVSKINDGINKLKHDDSNEEQQ